MKRYINTIAIDNNSIELHNKLKELGYKPLSWTTNSGKEMEQNKKGLKDAPVRKIILCRGIQ